MKGMLDLSIAIEWAGCDTAKGGGDDGSGGDTNFFGFSIRVM